MKKTNKIICVILAVIVMCSSIPFVIAEATDVNRYTVTQNEQNYTYYSDGTQFVRSGNGDNAYMNIWVDNHYRFMLTEENQKFYFVQNLRLQHQYELFQSKSTYFDKIALYTGQTLSGTPDTTPTEAQAVATNELIENNKLQEAYWTAANDNAQEKVDDLGTSYKEGTIPEKYEFHANAVSGGNKNYYWDGLASFEATEGFTKTYYNALSWYKNDSAKNSGTPTNYVIFGITLEVVDVLELKAKVNELKAQIEAYEKGESQDLTETRYLKLRKYVEAVPSSMLDGSSYYSQAEVDAMYAYITETSTGLADYTEFNKLRKKIEEITKKDGDNYVYGDGYTTESLDKVVEKYNTVKGLSITLPVSQQSEVDEATAVLEDALELLVAKSFYEQKMQSISQGGDVWDLSNDKLSSNWTDAKLDVHIIGTKYMYMQTYDDQNFNLYQWIFMRSRISPSPWSDPHPVLKYFVFDDIDSCGEGTCFDAGVNKANNSQAFVDRLSAEQKAESTNGTGYANWYYVGHDYRYYEGNTESIENKKALCSDDGTINEITIGDNGLYGRNTFLADANMIFTGLSGDTKSSQQDISFVWKFGVDNKEDSSNLYHFHVPVEVTLSDARDLVKLYDELTALAEDEEERLKYTESSINTILPALAEIPMDLIYGGKYYTQEEIDVYYNQLLGVKDALELVADYTEFDETYKTASEITNDTVKYEPTAFESYVEKISKINNELNRRLGVTQQDLIKAETQKLVDAMTELEQYAYCDYSTLDLYIAHAKSVFPENNDAGKFKPETYKAMMATLAKAEAVERGMVKGVDNVNQKTIDDVANELLNSIYYDYYDTSAKDIINSENKNGEEKVYLDDAFEKFKEDYNTATDKLEENIKNESISNDDAFKEAVEDLSGAHTTLEESKIVDLTEINNAINTGKEVENEGYTDSSWDDLQNAIDKAEDIVATNPVHGKDGVGTESVEDATRDILDAIDNLKIKADYTDYENLKKEIDEIISAGKDELHTEEDWNKFVDSVTEIDSKLDKDLADTEENNEIIKSAMEELEHAKAVYESTGKADYSELDSALEQAKTILNDTTGKYTESSKTALQEAYTKANAVDRELSSADQSVVDALKEELSKALLGVRKRADYSRFNEAVKTAEELLNNKDITYTSSSKQALEQALNVKENISDDLTEDEQGQLDTATESIIDATNNLVKAADTKELKEQLDNAKEIIAKGNEDTRYDDEDWQSFVDSVTEAEQSVGENLTDIPETEQENVNSAKDKISTATETLNNKRYIFVKFVSDSGEIFESYRIPCQESKIFGELEERPEIPENTDSVKYLGWYYKDGTLMQLSDSITDDVIVFCIEEEIKIIAKEDSDAVIDTSKGFVKGIRDGATVRTLVDSLENESEYIVVKDKEGNPVESDSKIATGMTIELVSKTENGKKNDTVTVVVKADVNGDGLVNDDDVEKSLDACCNRIKYTEAEKAYFEANDTNGDGVLDVLDAFNVSNMRYGNY